MLILNFNDNILKEEQVDMIPFIETLLSNYTYNQFHIGMLLKIFSNRKYVIINKKNENDNIILNLVDVNDPILNEFQMTLVNMINNKSSTNCWFHESEIIHDKKCYINGIEYYMNVTGNEIKESYIEILKCYLDGKFECII